MNLRTVGWIASFAAGMFAVACGPGGSPASVSGAATVVSNPTAPAAAPQPTAAATAVVRADFDQQFIDMMVPHHEGALGMARIAQQRAERPELRQLADDILLSQDAEITRMRQWRQTWFGSAATPPMNQMPMLDGMAGMSHAGQTMDMAADAERLRTAPERFDVAFIDAMIPHHQSAIEAARMAFKQSSRPEIQDLAIAILGAQQREIGQMLAWRLAWSQVTSSAAFATPATGEMPGMTMPGHEVPAEDMNH
jgi:uncharacterized protein (DUF305 family)